MEDGLEFKEKEVLKEVFTKGTNGFKIYIESGGVCNIIIKRESD